MAASFVGFTVGDQSVVETYDSCLALTLRSSSFEFTSHPDTEVGDLLVVVTTMFFDWQVDYQTKLSPDGGDPPDLCGLEETKSIADLSVIEYNWPSGWTSRLVNRWQFQQSLVSGDPWWEYRVYTHTRLATHAGEHTYTGWTLEP